MLKWISEAEALPRTAQKVLLAHPRQAGEFWDLHVAQILIQYEGVCPMPVKVNTRWPANYWWSWGDKTAADLLVTGNAWWAFLDGLPLPPGAEHATERGYSFIAQPRPVFVGQSKDEPPKRW